MQKWEYGWLRIEDSLREYKETKDKMNDMGKNGWELVCLFEGGSTHTMYYFKRPIEEPEKA